MGKLTLSRRKFLIGSALIGGALVIGYASSDAPDAKLIYGKTTKTGEFALNGWIKIDSAGKITIAISHQEMGQGVHTALAMLVAEELEADWSDIAVENAAISPVYANRSVLKDSLPFFDSYHDGEESIGEAAAEKIASMIGLQVTGGSTSVRDSWEPMRAAGASARQMLINAAADQWKIAPADCSAKKGVVENQKTGEKISYAALAAAASQIELDDIPSLKQPGSHTLIGSSPPRLDIPAKVAGSAEFGVDISLPDMLHAAVQLSPVFTGRVTAIDDAKASLMPGVEKIVPLENGVAVIADSFWRAKQAAEAVEITFDDGDAATVSTHSIFALFEQQLDSEEGRSYADDGDVDEAFQNAAHMVEATYKLPFLAHATLEPINCTALVTDNSVEVWVPTQVPTLAKWLAEKVADVPAENVTVHTPYIGGGFGRRLDVDMVVMAVTIAKAMKNRPVKMLWTRENDIQHDMYRPAALSRFKAGLDASGNLIAWHHRLASPSISGAFTERLLPWADMDMPDNTTVDGAANLPYRIDNFRVEHVPTPLPVPVGFWRSVGHSGNAFLTQGFMDEMALAADMDPFQFRHKLLENNKAAQAVLLNVAQEAKWGLTLPPNRGRGIALHESFGSIVGQVVEVTVDADNVVQIDKVFCVIDCGTVVNPDTVIDQMQGGIIFGLSAALFGEIEIENGRAVQENFPDYDMIRLANVPQIKVALAPSGRRIGGVGEPGVPPIAPALVNAIFDATGKRLRELPITKGGFTAA